MSQNGEDNPLDNPLEITEKELDMPTSVNSIIEGALEGQKRTDGM